ncbi:MAG: GNAT family N-acetyltransferase [Chloroflexota bacterium]
MTDLPPLSLRPLTPDLWADFERLFGTNGACGGCWCMFWKLRGKAFTGNTGEPARQMQKNIVDSGTVPGLLAFIDDEPVGWVAVEPRLAYLRLAHSKVLGPVDESDVWSVTCFFVARQFRRRGLTVQLLKGAVEYVKSRGGKIVEGYPVDASQQMPAAFIYTGTSAAFQKAGFVEVARRSESRPIFRYVIG